MVTFEQQEDHLGIKKTLGGLEDHLGMKGHYKKLNFFVMSEKTSLHVFFNGFTSLLVLSKIRHN